MFVSPQFAPTSRGVPVRSTLVGVLVAWFLIVLGASILGVFSLGPAAVGLAAALPIVIFAVAYRGSAAVRRLVAALDVRQLTLLQSLRAGGLVVVILYAGGLLPGVFALPAGLGDFAIGITAPLFGAIWLAGNLVPRPLLVAWHLLGLLDLTVAATLAVLVATGLLAAEPTTSIVATLPLSLIPTFELPLFFIAHLAALIQVGRGWAEPALFPPRRQEARVT
jgi:hypothetical protein